MEEILKWYLVSIFVWPVLVLLWENLVVRFIKWAILDLGLKGFSPLLYNLASSLTWFASGVVIINLLGLYASYHPGEGELLGISMKAFSDILPIEFSIPLAISALTLNAFAHNWSK